MEPWPPSDFITVLHKCLITSLCGSGILLTLFDVKHVTYYKARILPCYQVHIGDGYKPSFTLCTIRDILV